MPGGFGTSGPWGSAGDTYTAPSSSSSGNDGRWSQPDPNPVTTVPDIINEPIQSVGSAGSYGGGEEEAYAPYYNSDPGVGKAPVEVWDEEDIDYLGDKLVSKMTNEEIASYSPGQTYNPDTGNIVSSYDVYQVDPTDSNEHKQVSKKYFNLQKEISISQANYDLYGNDLSNWPADAKLQAQMSGFFGMQGEGVLGGSIGLEKEINAQKKIVNEGGAGYKEALASLTAQFGNEELAKMSAMGIEKYLMRKTKGDYQEMADILSGDAKIEGLENFNFNKFIEQTGGLSEQYYDKKTGEALSDAEAKNNPDAQLGIHGDAMGYDPSGVYTWAEDIESTYDAEHFEKTGEKIWTDPFLKDAYYGLTTGDPTQIPDWLYDKYLKEIGYYTSPSFDEWWHDDPGTPWGQEWYDYPIGDEETTMAKLPHWRSKALPTEMAAMGEMEQMYGAEFGKELMASPIFMAGAESTTGIPYQGIPEFGTVEMGVG